MNSNSEKSNEEVKHIKKKVYIILFFLVVIVFMGCWLYLSHYHPDSQERGTFGDQFGFVNALFSGLAFAGMICAVLLQKDELALQRRQLEENHLEMERQTEQFEKQNENLRIQRFENTFFSMLELQQQIVNQLSYDEIRGRALFRYAFEETVHEVDGGGKVKGLAGAMSKDGFDTYMNSNTPTYFDHYFRHLYTILKFVEHNEWLDDKRYQYASFLRATLSRYELVWLFYNGLSDYGRDKLKPLLEDYSMLKNLRVDLLTLCKDNRILLEEKGITDRYSCFFSGTDFEFHIIETGSCNNEKYQLSAFYGKDKEEEGQKLLNNWRTFMFKHGLTP